jgi:hypothetical protein
MWTKVFSVTRTISKVVVIHRCLEKSQSKNHQLKTITSQKMNWKYRRKKTILRNLKWKVSYWERKSTWIWIYPASVNVTLSFNKERCRSIRSLKCHHLLKSTQQTLRYMLTKKLLHLLCHPSVLCEVKENPFQGLVEMSRRMFCSALSNQIKICHFKMVKTKMTTNN